MAQETFGGLVLDIAEPGISVGILKRQVDGRWLEMPPLRALFLFYLARHKNNWVPIGTKPEFAGMTDEALKQHARRTRHGVAAFSPEFKILGSVERGYRLEVPNRKPKEIDLRQWVTPYHVAQATREDIAWAAALAERTYGGNDIIPEETMADWWSVSPTGFSILFKDGKRVGNLDVLPLRRGEVREAFLAGRIIERKLRGIDLYRPAERESIDVLYVESIVIDADRNGVATRRMLEAFQEIARRLCSPHQACKVYAISASTEGEGLLQPLGFTTVGTPDERRDKHQLWTAPLPLVLARIAAIVRVPIDPDFGPVVGGGL
jgi:hypothetical protein